MNKNELKQKHFLSERVEARGIRELPKTIVQTYSTENQLIMTPLVRLLLIPRAN